MGVPTAIVAPEVEDGDLAHAPTNALAAHQAESEIGLAGDLVGGTGLTDIHLPDARRKSKGKFSCYNLLWHNKTLLKSDTIKINLTSYKVQPLEYGAPDVVS